jgi:hypothetical protein
MTYIYDNKLKSAVEQHQIDIQKIRQADQMIDSLQNLLNEKVKNSMVLP